MKKYILKNLEPMLIGFVIAILTIYFFNLISDTIIKIALIKK
jgi:hypothetical protein